MSAAEESKRASSHLYWARNRSEEVALTGEHRPLTPQQAAALARESHAGAAWNKAATWEEKNITSWAKALLSDQILPEMTFEVPPPLPSPEGGVLSSCKGRVAAVESVKGEATFVLSRGKEKVLFELAIKLKLEVEVLDEQGCLHTILSGSLNLAEVSNDELNDAKMPHGKFSCDQAAWTAFFESCAKAGWPSLQGALQDLVEKAKEKWRK